MGGQETLLLAARHPSLLAGAAAFDSVADFALQYRNLPRLRCDAACLRIWAEPIGVGLQDLVRTEVGASPDAAPAAYAARSPLHFARAIAQSCVPLQLWWSRADLIVVDSARQSGRLLTALERQQPRASVEGFVGSWIHTAAFRSTTRLPFALAHFGLLPKRFDRRSNGLKYLAIAGSSTACARP